MGDRCTVYIDIMKIDYEWLMRSEFKDDREKLLDEIGASALDDNDSYVTFTAYEVNYASWNEIEDLLRKHSIEYDKMNSAGDDYGEGYSFGRIIPGKGFVEIDVDEVDRYKAEWIARTLELPDDKLRAALEAEYKAIYPIDVAQKSWE